jgi:hypothetical protein
MGNQSVWPPPANVSEWPLPGRFAERYVLVFTRSKQKGGQGDVSEQ